MPYGNQHAHNDRKPQSKKSFEVDDRVVLKIRFGLATRLGEFILNEAPIEDKELQALGHNLNNLDD